MASLRQSLQTSLRNLSLAPLQLQSNISIDANANVIKAAAALVKEVFQGDMLTVAQCQLKMLKEAEELNQLVSKYVGLSDKAEDRLKKDSKASLLQQMVSQQGRLHTLCASQTAKESLTFKVMAPRHFDNQDFEMQTFMVSFADHMPSIFQNERVVDSIALWLAPMREQATTLVSDLQAECKGYHLEDTSWKKSLPADASLSQAQEAADSTLSDLKGVSINKQVKEGGEDWVDFASA